MKKKDHMHVQKINFHMCFIFIWGGGGGMFPCEQSNQQLLLE